NVLHDEREPTPRELLHREYGHHPGMLEPRDAPGFAREPRQALLGRPIGAVHHLDRALAPQDRIVGVKTGGRPATADLPDDLELLQPRLPRHGGSIAGDAGRPLRGEPPELRLGQMPKRVRLYRIVDAAEYGGDELRLRWNPLRFLRI